MTEQHRRNSLPDIKITKSLAFGDVFVLHEVALRLHMDKILGKGKQGRLALWQVIAHLILPSYRSPALFLAPSYAIHAVLGLERNF